MNAAICWKEYRQQRTIWVVMAALGLLLFAALMSMAPGGIWKAIKNDDLEGAGGIMSPVMLCFGIVCGALLMAGDKEGRTLLFLDTLPRPRLALWRAKLFAGAGLTLTLALFFTVVALSLGDTHSIVLFAPFGLDALAWGMLGGAICRNVLVACVVAILLAASTWLMGLATVSAVGVVLVKSVLALIAVGVSATLFCQPDLARRKYARAVGQTLPSERRGLVPPSARVLIWLAIRQGRWLFLTCLAACIVLGLFLDRQPLLLYPIGTLLIGLVCGLATFLPEQTGRQQIFLGAQRFPPGKMWAIKVGLWAAAAILLTLVTCAAAIVPWLMKDAQATFHTGRGLDWNNQWFFGLMTADIVWLLVLWPVYGFCLGQFFALCTRQPIASAVLAGASALAVSCLWMPSVLFGGLHFWQVLGPPVILLAATRFFLWPWLAGRLTSKRPLLGLCALSLTSVLWLAGSIWYRIVEVPDVGEPFDIQAFLAGIPSPENNEAGALIRQGAVELGTYLKEIAEKLPPPKKPLFADAAAVVVQPGGPLERAGRLGMTAASDSNPYYYQHFLQDVLIKGWPKEDKEFSHWLDLMFQGKWFKQVYKAARLPLGVVYDPRHAEVTTFYPHIDTIKQMTDLLMARALQFQHQKKFDEALEQFDTLLGLARQLRNHGAVTPCLVARNMERACLSAHKDWLQELGQRPVLLKKSLELLRHHESLLPDRLDSGKAEYFYFQNTIGQTFDPSVLWRGTPRQTALRTAAWTMAWQVPWEKERQNRLTNAIYQAWTQRAGEPFWKHLAEEEHDRQQGAIRPDVFPSVAMELGLPSKEGPGSRLNADSWGRLVLKSWAWLVCSPRLWPPDELAFLRGELLATALALYQAENGKALAKLDDLVPRYLPSLPIDPFSGRAFHYRSSGGEKITVRSLSGGTKTFILRAGQHLVWSEGLDSFRPEEYRNPDNRFLFPVPIWTTRK
jgi:hypothetical protein